MSVCTTGSQGTVQVSILGSTLGKQKKRKIGLDAFKAERSYKNIHTSYVCYLKKRKSVHSGLGLDFTLCSC